MTWWHYLLLVNFYLVLFFGFYTLLLRRETFFQLNRVYLVAASLLSFLIPLIQSNWAQNLFITQRVHQTLYNSQVITVYNFTPVKDVLTMGEVLNTIYITVTLFLILRLAWQLVILKKAIEKPSPSAAYSFFKKISLGKDLADRDIINKHEQVHARQWHSVDVMIIETVMIINWFNPVVYLYRFAIKYIHEYIADRQVVQAGTDKADYALLLLSQTFEVQSHQLVTPFYNHSLLKKRIMMLQKSRSQRIMLAKYGLSAPLFALMLIFSSATVNNSQAVTSINNKVKTVFAQPAADAVTGITEHAEIPELLTDVLEDKPVVKNTPATTYLLNEVNIDTVKNADAVYTAVQNAPNFPGGMDAFGKFLSENIRYPAVDKEAKVMGKVFVAFVVDKDGSLRDIKAIRGPSETLNNEAVRVLKLSPRWVPGYDNSKPVNVAYTVPINFTLGDESNDKVFIAVENPPQFPGGMEAFANYLRTNVRYPAVDKQANVQGKVYITFIIEGDGSLSSIKAIRGPSETLENEGVRVMSNSPKWVPGYQNGKVVRVQYTVPISFTLGQPATPVALPVTGAMPQDSPSIQVLGYGQGDGKQIDIRTVVGLPKDNQPLFVIDGVVKNKNDFDKMDANTIESFSVLKDGPASVYGEAAKNGVILVVTKKGLTNKIKIKK